MLARRCLGLLTSSSPPHGELARGEVPLPGSLVHVSVGSQTDPQHWAGSLVLSTGVWPRHSPGNDLLNISLPAWKPPHLVQKVKRHLVWEAERWPVPRGKGRKQRSDSGAAALSPARAVLCRRQGERPWPVTALPRRGRLQGAEWSRGRDPRTGRLIL